MSLTLSPQMKIVALVGLLAVLALGAGTMIMGRSQPSSSAAPLNVPLKHMPRRTTAAPAAAKPAVKAAAPAPAAPKTNVAVAPAVKTTHVLAAPKAKPVAKPAPAATPKPAAPVVPAVAADGLPGALDLLLHGHRVVIVALWDPEIPSDRYAYLEAQAGAKAANAGFLGVSVLDERVAAPLTAAVGGGTVLQSPGVLVYKQPNVLMNKIDGFSDRDAIAEAVANALIDDTPPQGVAPAAAAPATTTVPAAPAAVPAP
jgi:hypothetical protein